MLAKRHRREVGIRLVEHLVLAERREQRQRRRRRHTVWTWAGAYRTHEVNIGNTPLHEVPVRVPAALDDARHWTEHKTYGTHELAVRLHHRLVPIHPFVNGNGRCTRATLDAELAALWDSL